MTYFYGIHCTQTILANIEVPDGTEGGGGGIGSFMFPVIVVLVVGYLVALGLLLHRLALRGTMVVDMNWSHLCLPIGPDEFACLLPPLTFDGYVM